MLRFLPHRLRPNRGQVYKRLLALAICDLIGCQLNGGMRRIKVGLRGLTEHFVRGFEHAECLIRVCTLNDASHAK